MGRKKIQITRIMDERNRQVSPLGMGGWMCMRMGDKRSGWGRKEKHPTWPSTISVLWEIVQCLLGKYSYCFWWRQFNWLKMISQNLTNQREGIQIIFHMGDLKTSVLFRIQSQLLQIVLGVPAQSWGTLPHSHRPLSHATQFSHSNGILPGGGWQQHECRVEKHKNKQPNTDRIV